MRVRFTASAKIQFLSALSFIRLDNPQAAIDYRNRAESVLRRLEEFPESGRIVPEFPELPYREVVTRHTVFFTGSKGTSSGLLLYGMVHSFLRNRFLEHPSETWS